MQYVAKYWFIILMGCVFFLGACSENMSSRFDSYEEVQRSGLIEKGWLPSVIPAGAYNITESHNLDTNRGNGEFSFTDNDVIIFRNDLAGRLIAKIGQTCPIKVFR